MKTFFIKKNSLPFLYSFVQTLLQIDVKKIVAAILASGRHYSRRRGLQTECPLFFYHYGSDYLGKTSQAPLFSQFKLVNFVDLLVKFDCDFFFREYKRSGTRDIDDPAVPAVFPADPRHPGRGDGRCAEERGFCAATADAHGKLPAQVPWTRSRWTGALVPWSSR